MFKLYRNYIILGAFVIIFSCDDVEPILSNTIIINPDYELNLNRTDSGLNKYSASISWNKYIYEDFDKYIISSDTIFEVIDSAQTSTYTFNMVPGEFRNVEFFLVDNLGDTIYQDSIQIFSRIISPINWKLYGFDINGLGHHTLEWHPSEETETEFSHYSIYRSVNTIIDDLEYINPDNCIELSTCVELINIFDQNIEIYTDESSVNQGYSYMIATYDTSGLYRTSTIKIKGVDIPDILSINNVTASIEYKNVINLNWELVIDNNEFHKIHIWRGPTDEVNNDTSINTLLATIVNPEIVNFEDRNNVGSNTTWYYMIEIMNIFGKTYNSTVVEGITIP